MAYPVLHKAGRQLPLNYDLTSDNSFWMKVTSGSTTSWFPAGGQGWAGSPMGVGNLGYSITTDGSTFITITGFVYLDSAGTPHRFAGTAGWFACPLYSPCGDFTLTTTTTAVSCFKLNVDAFFVGGQKKISLRL